MEINDFMVKNEIIKVRYFVRLLKELGLYAYWIKKRKEYMEIYKQEYNKELFHFILYYYSFKNMLMQGTTIPKIVGRDVEYFCQFFSPIEILNNQVLLHKLRFLFYGYSLMRNGSPI